MTGLVSGVVAFGLLAATALAAAATLRLRSLAEFALAAYLFAFGEAVLLVLVLSPFGAVERRVLLVGLTIPCASRPLCGGDAAARSRTLPGSAASAH